MSGFELYGQVLVLLTYRLADTSEYFMIEYGGLRRHVPAMAYPFLH